MTEHRTEPLDPVAALRRIAFLLERRLADSYRIKAYRGAAATPADRATPTRCASARRAGTLRAAARASAPRPPAIVEECLAGRVPGVPHRAGGAPPGRSPRAARTYRAALRGRPAHALRLVRRRLADRGDGDDRDASSATSTSCSPTTRPGCTVANGLSVARLTQQLEVVDAVNDHLGDDGGFRLLHGHRGRHPRRRRARPDRRDARPARPAWSPRCTPSCGWTGRR